MGEVRFKTVPVEFASRENAGRGFPANAGAPASVALQ